MAELKIYQAINNIQADLASIGISKSRKNQQQGYAFRGIDEVYGAIAPLLAKHKVCIFPRCLSRNCVERTNSKGNPLFYVDVDVEYDLVSAEDGSKQTVKTYGEAMDSADKATNKAMSAAYKYMCLQTFCIPTEGDNDADATTHELAARKTVQQQQAPKTTQWANAEIFAQMLEFCDTVDAVQECLNQQRTNPNLQTLIPLATAKKHAIEAMGA